MLTLAENIATLTVDSAFGEIGISQTSTVPLENPIATNDSEIILAAVTWSEDLDALMYPLIRQSRPLLFLLLLLLLLLLFWLGSLGENT